MASGNSRAEEMPKTNRIGQDIPRSTEQGDTTGTPDAPGVSGHAGIRDADKDLGFACFSRRIWTIAPETGSLKTASTANLPGPETDS